MGIVCELYRIPDSEIEKLEKKNSFDLEEFLAENYSWVYGKMHKSDDTVFAMDKAWDVTKFLLKRIDSSKEKVLDGLDKKFIYSEEVKKINLILEKIMIDDLMELTSEKELTENKIYRPNSINHKDYIEFHLALYKNAFKRASELDDGIVTNYC